jgi:hypothetical protein
MLKFRTRRSWLPTAFLVVATVAYCTTPTPSNAAGASARQAIAADYAKIDAAISSRNIAKALTFCTPDFTQTGTDGISADLTAVKREAKLEATGITSAQNQTRILSLTQTGKKAVATIRQILRVTTGHQRLSETEKETDTWVDTPRGWRLHSSVVLSEVTGN